MPKIIPPKPSDDKWFNKDVKKPFNSNRRRSTRYLRNDIGITIRKIGLLNFGFSKNKDFPVKLVDISSRGIGVLISTDLRLSLNKKVVLVIRFSDFKEFEISGNVVRSSPGMLVYGIQFDSINEKFADYLLKTQRRLAFK